MREYGRSVRLGAILPFSNLDGSPVTPAGLRQTARRLEDIGYDGIWMPQAIGRGFFLADPLIALAVAGAVTERVELGTAVLQVPLYHPVDLAHRVATTRLVCGDRLVLGIGAGSTPTDFEAFGRDPAARFVEFDRGVARLRALLEGRDAEAELSIPSAASAPQLVFGSWGRGVERAARDFDGWMASGRYRSDDEVIGSLAGYRAAGGRRAMVSTIGVGAELDALGERLGRFAAAGFDDAIVLFGPGAPPLEEVRALVG